MRLKGARCPERRRCLQPITPGSRGTIQDALSLVDANNAVASPRQEVGAFFYGQGHAFLDHFHDHGPIRIPVVFGGGVIHRFFPCAGALPGQVAGEAMPIALTRGICRQIFAGDQH
jgi:hypothetical protein